MQQYQVSKQTANAQKQSLPQNNKYQQYPTRSPFNSVENHKQLPQFNSKDYDVTSRPIQPTPSPAVAQNHNQIFNPHQQLKRGSNSGHQDPKLLSTPLVTHGTNKTQGSQDYSIQFRVGQKRAEPAKDQLNDTNLSQMISNNNTMLKQFTCMSPTTQNRDNSIIFQSPQQKKELLQSPAMTHKMGFNLAQPPSQAQMMVSPQPGQAQLKPKQIVNYTNTVTVQQELRQIQEENLLLTQKTQALESEIQRGTQTTFIVELEQKIKLLSQINMKLQSENQDLMRIQDPEALRQSLLRLLSERKALQASLNQIKQETARVLQSQEEVTRRTEEEGEGSKIKELVLELENKVQNLIVENERLNQQLNSGQTGNLISEIQKFKQELEQVSKRYQQVRKEEEHMKNKVGQLEKRYENVLEQNVYADLKEKIQLLVEENQRLQGVISDCDVNDQDMEDLKERIRVVKLDNQKMEKQLKRKFP